MEALSILVRRSCTASILRSCLLPTSVGAVPVRHSNTLPGWLVEKHRRSRLMPEEAKVEPETDEEALRKQQQKLEHYRNVYPEFLPHKEWWKRDRLSQRLEHRDMLRRRSVINLPEFYVGSILAATMTDTQSTNKQKRFVGICIQREGRGLRSSITLRNVIDGQGVELLLELYSPLLLKLEVLKLERRLDPELLYLRDAPAEYSTVPLDFAPIPHPTGAPVPVNSIKVPLNPKPWRERWERAEVQGIQSIPDEWLNDWELRMREFHRRKPWHRLDLMKQYREEAPHLEPQAFSELDKYKNAEALSSEKGPKRARQKRRRPHSSE